MNQFHVREMSITFYSTKNYTTILARNRTRHGRSHGWTWGGNGPPNFFLNIIKYMGTNFSNFVLENYAFVPLKISLILLRALL